MAKGDDIEDRLINFAVRVIRLCASLPKSRVGRHIGDQLVRSGTAPAAHYAEARGAESRRDFTHKLKICLKELNESRIWLLMVERSNLIAAERLEAIVQECIELCRIISASIGTVNGRQGA
jgi:four helix bundle protein